MKREITFRAWNPKQKKFEYDFDVDADGNVGYINMFETYEPCRDWVLQQYIGMQDKDGNDVCEGDVVRILYTDWPSNTDPNIPLEDYLISISQIGVVEYEAPMFGIRMIKEDRYGELPFGSFNYGAHGRLEVIGNRYQHPELLTPTKKDSI